MNGNGNESNKLWKNQNCNFPILIPRMYGLNMWCMIPSMDLKDKAPLVNVQLIKASILYFVGRCS